MQCHAQQFEGYTATDTAIDSYCFGDCTGISPLVGGSEWLPAYLFFPLFPPLNKLSLFWPMSLLTFGLLVISLPHSVEGSKQLAGANPSQRCTSHSLYLSRQQQNRTAWEQVELLTSLIFFSMSRQYQNFQSHHCNRPYRCTFSAWNTWCQRSNLERPRASWNSLELQEALGNPCS